MCGMILQARRLTRRDAAVRLVLRGLAATAYLRSEQHHFLDGTAVHRHQLIADGERVLVPAAGAARLMASINTLPS